MPARRLEPENIAEPIEKAVGHSLPDAHGAVALHVRVPSDRTDSRAGPTHVAPEQYQVHDFLNRRDRLPLLRQSHGPASNHRLRSHHYFRDLPNLTPRDATLLDDV